MPIKPARVLTDMMHAGLLSCWMLQDGSHPIRYCDVPTLPYSPADMQLNTICSRGLLYADPQANQYDRTRSM